MTIRPLSVLATKSERLLIVDNPSWVDANGYIVKVQEYRGAMIVRDDDQRVIVLYDADGKPLVESRRVGFR